VARPEGRAQDPDHLAGPTAVIKGAPHPNAAKALAEFMISDTVQKLLPGEGIYAGPI
jgi:ABC-type Fe3+ transport system substrate-binding protein